MRPAAWLGLALLAAVVFAAPLAAAPAGVVDDATAQALGRRIYLNETGGDPAKLVWWNAGEGFPSLGIGHFIWYPAGFEGRFTESFPALLRFLAARGVALPRWLQGDPDCPWPDRDAFLAAAASERMIALRTLLERTVADQSRFIVDRLSRSLDRVVESFPSGAERERAGAQVAALVATAQGLYVLVDYVNFKGEGLSETERYRGEGWGLRQVIAQMAVSDDRPAADCFADAAARVLARRVANAPASRGEARWLPGWLSRLESYRTF